MANPILATSSPPTPTSATSSFGRSRSARPANTTRCISRKCSILTTASRDLYANKGYVDGEREARLKGQGWRGHIQRKGSKDKPISETQERRNKRIAKIRARVEQVFAGLAQMGDKVLRSIGLARATLHLNWKAAAYNLRRLSYLKEARNVAF